MYLILNSMFIIYSSQKLQVEPDGTYVSPPRAKGDINTRSAELVSLFVLFSKCHMQGLELIGT